MSRNHPHNHPYHYQIVIYFISKWYIWLVFQNISTIQLLMHYASCHVWGDVFSYSFLTYIFCTKILFAYLFVSTFEPMNPKNCVNLNILPNENIKTSKQTPKLCGQCKNLISWPISHILSSLQKPPKTIKKHDWGIEDAPLSLNKYCKKKSQKQQIQQVSNLLYVVWYWNH